MLTLWGTTSRLSNQSWKPVLADASTRDSLNASFWADTYSESGGRVCTAPGAAQLTMTATATSAANTGLANVFMRQPFARTDSEPLPRRDRPCGAAHARDR